MSVFGPFFARIRTACFGSVRGRPLRSFVLIFTGLVSIGLLGYYSWAALNWRRARADFEALRFDEAERQLPICRRVWPNDPEVLLLSAKTSRRLGKFDAAETYLNRFFMSHPESRDEGQLEFLLMRAQLGDDEAVDPLFARVEQGHPESPSILETISLMYMKRLRYLAANACLTKWIELCPERATPYEWRGWVYERTASPALAQIDYRKALDLDPSLLLVRLRLVELLLEEKKVPEVIPHLDYLQRHASDRVEVKARVGMLRYLEGNSAEARRLLEDVEPKLAKNDVTPVVYLARLDVQEGRGAEAERRLRRIIDLDPTESDARFVMISALRLLGRDADAQATEREQLRIRARTERVNQLLRDRADKADATADEWFEIGVIFRELHMDARALYWLEKALGRDPSHRGAHREMAEYYERSGDAAKAATHRRMLP